MGKRAGPEKGKKIASMAIIKKFLRRAVFGRKALQPFFARLFALSLEGMNIGTGGGDLRSNGEFFVIRHILADEPDPVVFDVGAQGGGYLKEVIRVTGGKGGVYAFEPCTRDFEPLRDAFGNEAEIIQSALGDHDGEATLFYPEGARGLSSLHKGDKGFSLSEKVKLETIDSFCERKGIDRITLLKLDVEGNELACLKGAQRMLPRIQNIQFEMSLASRDSKTYFRDIFDYLRDYSIYRILRNGFSLIQKPDKASELLFTTNFLAVRRKG